MSKDTFKLVKDYPVTKYHCGAHAGDRVRLRRDIIVRDHKDKPTGEVHHTGEVWTVLRGTTEIPPVIWLQQPNGEPHVWSDDSDFLATFEILR